MGKITYLDKILFNIRTVRWYQESEFWNPKIAFILNDL